jgi:hypothetical protein
MVTPASMTTGLVYKAGLRLIPVVVLLLIVVTRSSLPRLLTIYAPQQAAFDPAVLDNALNPEG